MSHEREPDGFELAADLKAVEQHLAGFTPAALNVDRDQLMFAAGRAAERAERDLAATHRVAGRNGWLWPAAAAMMTAASVVLATMLVRQNERISVVRNTDMPHPAVVTEHQPKAGDLQNAESLAEWPRASTWSLRPTSGYLEVRYVALTQGIGALQSDPSSGSDNGDSILDHPSKPATVRGLLDELLPPSISRTDTRS